MFKIPQAPKNSDHRNFYGEEKNVEDLLEQVSNKRVEVLDERSLDQQRDDLYKFKKSVCLTRNYELYLETEKAYYKFTKDKLHMQDPMERLASKIKRDEYLWLSDLKVWIGYNFLVFNNDE